MSFTRFHDDPCRIQKQLQQSTDPGRYMINVPGNGLTPSYMVDPCMRMQKWGANLMTNTIDLESKLMGIDRRLDRDCTVYTENPVLSEKIQYPNQAPFIEQPRATEPAWMVREIEQNNWGILQLDPQENVIMPFQNNLSTRVIEKNNFVATAPDPQLIF